MEEIRTKIQKRDFRGKVRHGAEWLQLWANPDDDLTTLERSEQRQRTLSFERMRRSIEKLSVPLSGQPDHLHPLPDARPDWSLEQWSIARGSLARTAFLKRFPCPMSGLADRLALARATALGLRDFPGLFPDLQEVSFKELEDAGCAHAFLAAQLPLERALVLVFSDRWSGIEEPLWNSGAVEMWASWLERTCPNSIPQLDAALHDPTAFTDASDAFFEELSRALSAPKKQPIQGPQTDPGETGDGDGEADANLTSFARDMFERLDDLGENIEQPDEQNAAEEARNEATLLVPFTTEFDREVSLSKVLPDTVFEQQAQRLREKYRSQHTEARRLSRALAMALRSRRQSDWQFDQEEGLIDASRLAQIVAAPHRRRTFKQEYQSQDLDAALTLLVDCSGSMRGKWMDLTTLALNALGDALNLAAVPFEVLGFTTAATNGGETLKAWRQAGSPAPKPGTAWRLNDLRHYVIKGFDQTWRQPKMQLPGLCEAALLKENIDHEAVEWAISRLRAYPASRRVLIVLSDGAPSCSTTERYTDATVLPEALRSTLRQRNKETEIYAVGLRHRAEEFYEQTVLVSEESDLIPRLIEFTRNVIL